MALTFRLATVDDADCIARIGHDSYLHHFKDIWHYRDELQDYVQQEYHPDNILKSLKQPLEQWWIITNPESIGFIKLSYDQAITVEHVLNPDLPFLARGVCLNKIYLLPQYTGQGLGQHIFNFIEKQLQQQQAPCFWLEVLQDNHPAKKFYLRQGMQVIGDGHYQYTRQQHHLHIMYKALDQRPTP